MENTTSVYTLTIRKYDNEELNELLRQYRRALYRGGTGFVAIAVLLFAASALSGLEIVETWGPPIIAIATLVCFGWYVARSTARSRRAIEDRSQRHPM